MRLFTLLLCIFSFCCNQLNSQVSSLYINEILASNIASNQDDATLTFPDWIELYNSTDTVINLGGFYISDNKLVPKKWMIPVNTTIPAGGYYSFWADNTNTAYHTNFELDGDGDFIGLYNSLGVVIDSFSFGEQRKDVSFGRLVGNLSQLAFFATPTKDAKNSSTSYASISAAPAYSKKGGFYSGTQSVILTSSSAGASIRYTLDGTEPTSSSTLYTTPISVTKTTAMRARAFETGTLSSKINTQTFFINEPINLPIISIVTNPANFFDDNIGIYITGTNGTSGMCDGAIRNLNQDWERPVNVELYEKNGNVGLNQEAGVKIFGGCSRTRFPQKSLALYARKEYGNGNFDYQIFPDKQIFQFEAFVLRSSADDQVKTFMRDALAQNTSIGTMDVDIQGYRPAVVFLNGVYWGIHEIREKIDEHYFESNYNVDKSTVNILEKDGNSVYGQTFSYDDLKMYIVDNSLSQAANYNHVKTLMDIDEFIDYEILHIYLGEKDWPGNNIKFWNSTATGFEKWRWICYDMDQTFTHTMVDALANATATDGPGWPNPDWSTFLLRNLLTNPDFKNRFIQRYAFYMNTTFEPTRLKSLVQSFKATLQPEIARHTTKWGGQIDPDFSEGWAILPTFASLNEWLANVNELNEFIDGRPNYAKSHILNKFGLSGMAGLTINSNIPEAGSVFIYDRKVPSLEFIGDFFNNVPMVVKATSNPGYRFLYWEFSGQITKNDSASEVSFTYSANQAITAHYEKYSGSEPFVIINEINYNSASTFNTGDWVEIYNKQKNPIDISGWKLKDGNDENVFKFPVGTEIGANNYLVVCEDIDLFYSHFPKSSKIRGNLGFAFDNGGEVIRLYDQNNVFVDSVHYDDIIPWPELADGDGYSLILRSPGLDNDLAVNWTSFLQGSPGIPNSGEIDVSTSYAAATNRFELQQNFPNPCVTATTISYSLGSKGKVDMKLYDISGREVLTMVNEYQNAGSYSISLNVEQLNEGVYFYSMVVDDLIVGTKKIIVAHNY